MPDIISDFLKPRSVRVQPESSTRARIIIEPFERGFGHTLGNVVLHDGHVLVSGGVVDRVHPEGAEDGFQPALILKCLKP